MIKKILQNNLNYTLKDPDHDEIKDGYQLRWVGKNYAKLQENLLPETIIVPDSQHNLEENNRNSQNLFLTGDNLEVLKHLEHAYTGKIDMIYIDPPYNTGSDGFVYNDDFRFTDDQLRDTLGLTDDEVKRIKNIYGKSSHSAWLTFMYPRLKLAKKLLKESGVIFISIDDNEFANLKILMDEIFNEGNFIANFKWNRVAKAPSLSGSVRTKYEYVMTYSKLKRIRLFGKESYNTQGPLWHLPNKRSLLLFPAKSIKVKQTFKKGIYGGTYNVELFDDLVEHNGYNKDPVRIKANSAWGQNKINEYVEDGFYFEIKKSPKTVYTTMTEEEGYIAPSDLINSVESGVETNTHANEKMKALGIPFSYSKPVSLIEYLVNMVTHSTNNAVILDFFAGSASTAHAVMNLNRDGNNRRYIMCTLDEDVKKGNEAEKEGYKTVDEIGRERIKRAAKQIGDTSGFLHYRFIKPNTQTLEQIEEFDPKKTKLIPDDMVSPFSEHSLTGEGSKSGVETILRTWLIDDGYEFATRPQQLDLAGYTAYYAPEIARIYLITGDNWTKESCKVLLNMLGKHDLGVNAIVVYSYSFGFIDLTELKNNLKANLDGKPELIERY